MGLDSVEIVMAWEDAFGISIPNEEAFVLRTPRMAIDLICKMLAVGDLRGPCLTVRAFHRLRNCFVNAGSVKRGSIRLETRIKDLVRSHSWNDVRVNCGIPSLPRPLWFFRRTVADLLRWMVIHTAKDLKAPDEPWTRSQVRHVVRAIVTDITGLDEFGDDDDFIEVMGID
jgi:hypothetical protein